MNTITCKTTRPRKEDLDIIKKRDQVCIYCGKPMVKPTIEHLNHRKDWDSVGSYYREGKPVTEIVGMCCGSCNSSRQDKSLQDWFEGDYCVMNNINKDTVAPVVKNFLDMFYPKF